MGGQRFDEVGTGVEDERIESHPPQGEIAAFDLFCMLLERDGMVQLVYKHAISTVQPLHALDLTGENEQDD